jgi:1-acyl-sn-glycerol-3-phosphate acyltransferase
MFDRQLHRRSAPRAGPPGVSRPSHLHVVPTPAAALDPRLLRFDPEFVRRAAPVLGWITDHWFRAEVEGTEHLSDRASLFVSTHNGSLHTPDMYTLMVAFWRRFGTDKPGHGLMHRAAFRVPVMGRVLERLGALPAHPDNGRLALRADRPLLICPGGDVDALKPWRDRHRVDFGQRRGFVKLAIQEQVPIIPIVSVGAHETIFVLNDGTKLAKYVPFARYFRVKSVPLAFGLPFGVTPAGIGNIPLPSKIRQRVLPPIHIDAPPAAAADPAVVDRWFRHIQAVMQTALDELAAERRWPVLG